MVQGGIGIQIKRKFGIKSCKGRHCTTGIYSQTIRIQEVVLQIALNGCGQVKIVYTNANISSWGSFNAKQAEIIHHQVGPKHIQFHRFLGTDNVALLGHWIGGHRTGHGYSI